MNYISEQSSLIWLWFTLYAVTILLLVPVNSKFKSKIETAEDNDKQALDFASKMILRTALIFPMLLLIKNTI